MKLVLLLLLLNPIVSIAQEITFNLIAFYPCQRLYENELLFTLTSGTETFNISDTSGTIKLPREGNYTLVHSFSNSNFEIFIQFGHNQDTVWMPQILHMVRQHDSSYYQCCDHKCDGQEADFYENGQIRMKGRFDNGIPTSKLKFYNSDGTLKRVESYDTAGVLLNTKIY